MLKITRSREFTADSAWDALDVANMNGVTTRLHLADAPYQWHINDGEEVFTVLDGVVDMHYRENGIEKTAVLNTGDVFFAGIDSDACRSSARRRPRSCRCKGR